MSNASTTDDRPARLSLRRNFSWVFLGNVVFAFSQWAIIALLTKFGSAEAVGQFGLALAVVTPVIMFASLHLRSVIATDAKEQYSLRDYLTLRFIMLGLAMLAIVAISWIGDVAQGYRWLIVFITIGKVLESTSDVVYGRFQQWERMNLIGQSQMLKAMLCVVIGGLACWQTGSAVWAAAGLVVARLLGLLLFDLPCAAMRGNSSTAVGDSVRAPFESDSLRLQVDRIWRLFVTAFPLGLVMLLISLNANVSRYFIAHYQGEAVLGIFLSMSYIVIVAGRLFNSLGQAASPRLATLYADGKISQFRALLRRLHGLAVAIGMLGLGVAWFAGKPILTWCYTAEYAERVDVFVVLMAGGALTYAAAFSGYGMTATRQFGLQPLIVFCAFGTQTALCWWLIPQHGLMGAAVASLSAPLIQLMLMGWCTHRATMRQAARDLPSPAATTYA